MYKRFFNINNKIKMINLMSFKVNNQIKIKYKVIITLIKMIFMQILIGIY
jgi:hypothetical protein